MEPVNGRAHQGDGMRAAVNEQPSRSGDELWRVAGILYAWRRFIIGVTAAAAVAAVIISLMMPNWYAAAARVLPPEQSATASLAGALTRGLPSAAASLFGGKKGDYSRYLAILTSRGMYEAVVDSFNLAAAYELTDAAHPRAEAVEILKANVAYSIDAEWDFLSITAYDTEPRRAAEIANFIVRHLNLTNAELASQNAGQFRHYIEGRYGEALAASDSLLNALQAFQKQFGLFDVPAQTQQFFEQVADLRANAIEAEIRHETLRAQLGPDNPEVQTFADAARISNSKYRAALSGQEQLLPVSTSEMSDVLRQYLVLEREGQIQARILEVVRPLLEQARFDERRQVEAVQIVDAAVPPIRKAKPRRSVIVVAATLSAFLLCIAFALAYEWWQRRHAYVAMRLQSIATTPDRAARRSVTTLP